MRLVAGMLTAVLAAPAGAQVVTTTLVTPTTIPFPSTTVTLPGGTSTSISSTTVTSTPSTTATTLPSTTSTSATTSTSTSTTVPCTEPPPPKDCAADAASKEDCLDCCSEEFKAQLSCAENYDCPSWADFVDAWTKIGADYAECLDSRGVDTSPFAPGRCEARNLQAGCAAVAGRHPQQCEAVKECVSCCGTVLHRARVFQLRQLKRTKDTACRAAAHRLRKAERKRARCRRVCQAEACQSPISHCLDVLPSLGRCYEKCRDKCADNRWARGLCLTACRNLDCDRLETCLDKSGDASEGGRCLPRTDPIECVQATTTTSTSTTTFASTTTSVSTVTTVISIATTVTLPL